MRMMRVIAAMLVLLFLAACATTLPKTTPGISSPRQHEELRAVWISFFELMQPEGGVSEHAFHEQFNSKFQQIADFGFCTIFVHVQPFSDAIWPSAYAPWSHVLTRQQGQNPGFDPLYILSHLAIEHNLALHAWFNPFRISDAQGLAMLYENNPALRHIEAGDGMVFESANGWLVWNPAMPDSHLRLLNSIREVLENYPVAGIHIDDYFYPGGENTAMDAAQYAAYIAQGGTRNLGDWRRENINALVHSLYETVKNINPDAIVSISPAGNMDKNYNEMFADLSLWLREPGFADWIIPQIYFGFEHPQFPFEATANAWLALPRHENTRMFVGLAGHKIGREDQWAGTGRYEWLEHDDILARQVQMLRGINGVEGFAVFSANNLVVGTSNEIALAERDNLRNIMED